MMASAVLSDNIPCDRLCIDEDTSSFGEISQNAGQATKDGNSTQRQENLAGVVLASVD
jgi:hypothetical protein